MEKKTLILKLALIVMTCGFLYQTGMRIEDARRVRAAAEREHDSDGTGVGRKFIPCTVDLIVSGEDGKVYEITQREMGCNVAAGFDQR